jgi:hypothetical protein
MLERVEMLRRIGAKRSGQCGVAAQLPLDPCPAPTLVARGGASQRPIAKQPPRRPAQTCPLDGCPGGVERIPVDRSIGEALAFFGQDKPRFLCNVASGAPGRMALVQGAEQCGRQARLGFGPKRLGGAQSIGAIGHRRARPAGLSHRLRQISQGLARLIAVGLPPAPAPQPALKRRKAR